MPPGGSAGAPGPPASGEYTGLVQDVAAETKSVRPTKHRLTRSEALVAYGASVAGLGAAWFAFWVLVERAGANYDLVLALIPWALVAVTILFLGWAIAGWRQSR